MTLKEWLRRNKRRGLKSDLAGKVGVTRQTITNLAAGDVPSVSLALRICEHTGREVGVADWPERKGGGR